MYIILTIKLSMNLQRRIGKIATNLSRTINIGAGLAGRRGMTYVGVIIWVSM